VDRGEALGWVQRKAIHGRLKNMLEFEGEIIYRAYFVDPNRIDLNYEELEDRRI
jgi:hypothetical protein